MADLAAGRGIQLEASEEGPRLQAMGRHQEPFIWIFRRVMENRRIFPWASARGVRPGQAA